MRFSLLTATCAIAYDFYFVAVPLFMSFPSQWFHRRRGLATGIAVSGSGIGGGISSLILRGLLPRIGYRNSMLVRSLLSIFEP